MAISTNYAVPVVVNGFLCRNCTDVDNAKKHIDPAHPKSGPFNITAKDDPTRAVQQSVTSAPSASSAVTGLGAIVDITA